MFRRSRSRRLEQIVEQIDEIDMQDCEPPEGLERRVRKVLEKHPAKRWDAAVAEIALHRTNASK